MHEMTEITVMKWLNTTDDVVSFVIRNSFHEIKFYKKKFSKSKTISQDYWNYKFSTFYDTVMNYFYRISIRIIHTLENFQIYHRIEQMALVVTRFEAMLNAILKNYGYMVRYGSYSWMITFVYCDLKKKRNHRRNTENCV